MFCGVVTGVGTEKQRCLFASPDHRGPHWSHAEPISCDCKYNCQCNNPRPPQDAA